jgi:hypothetical protein
MKKVDAKTDGDGHWFVIPSDMGEEFAYLLEKGEEADDYEEFENKFGKYSTGGDLNLVQLYAEID